MVSLLRIRWYICAPKIQDMKALSKNAIVGYPAGVITGITYGLNPLFAVPLMSRGATIESILFFRYGFAVVLLGLFLMLSRQSFKLSGKQAGVLLILGLLYTTSSLCLFGAYNYIASGLATTLIFLYPVLVAIIMAGQCPERRCMRRTAYCTALLQPAGRCPSSPGAKTCCKAGCCSPGMLQGPAYVISFYS